ncbi:hypothetical protein FQZ97_710530 [compost metagenome]
MVCQVQMYGGHAAIAAHQPRYARHFGRQRGIVHRVDGHRTHLRIPLVVALVELAHRAGERSHREHAGHALHRPDEAVLVLPQGDVFAGRHGALPGLLRAGLEDHTQPIQADVVIAGDGHGIAIEARVLAQFRRAGLEGADDAIVALPDRNDEHDDGRDQYPPGIAPFGETGQTVQPAGAALAGSFLRSGVAAINPQHGRYQRQHHQIGDDLEGHAERGSDGQLTHHGDRDQQQGHEGHEGRHQRQGTGDQQAAEAGARRLRSTLAMADFPNDEVDLLHAMGNANGEHQEGHQYGEGI